ncbi:hypothetical protein C6P46_002329 [Rhodotorula mucilaginosa]|uniref:Uncharacterized protein n=1 Tax=Rhodotorula mucilaginosa TaxID=5537 RepID=A0A9P6VTU8_RHOMI|nr:hypothetical protein C6P46_002329 [Rhodotorula mucilaginosa]
MTAPCNDAGMLTSASRGGLVRSSLWADAAPGAAASAGAANADDAPLSRPDPSVEQILAGTLLLPTVAVSIHAQNEGCGADVDESTRAKLSPSRLLPPRLAERRLFRMRAPELHTYLTTL